ncbi:MAG: aconitase family protein, partial [Waddliaceae bacterium]
DRLTIANMTTEWGALVGLFPIDEVTIDWLKNRNKQATHPRLNKDRIEALENNIPKSDPDAFYAKTVTLDLSTVEPHISGPDHVKVMSGASEMEKKNIKINKAYLLSCVNGRADDFSAAAEIVRGKKVAEGVEFYISAASSEVQAESEKRGDWQALLEAGARPLPPGCGACIGLGAGLLEDGEVGISATNRNFKGRMGSRNAQAYLASPAVVAVSAIRGKIAGFDSYEPLEPGFSLQSEEMGAPKQAATELIEGFWEKIEGELIYCRQDNLNTDGIYPGKYTYIDDFPPEEMVKVVMENYDPGFCEIVKEGDILVGGFNFGTGSSREQAATALKYRGIQMIIGGSVSQTYKRNALNNGYIVIEVPELVKDLKAQFGEKALSIRTGWMASVDFRQSLITANDKTYKFTPMGKVAQELVLKGGLENWVKEE